MDCKVSSQDKKIFSRPKDGQGDVRRVYDPL